MAYWHGTDASGELPAYLAFVNVASGEVCSHPEVKAQNLWGGDVIWQGRNVLAVLSPDNDAWSGLPCSFFTMLDDYRAMDARAVTSPDNHYQAETATLGWTDELMHNVTTITELTTNQPVIEATWDGSPHAIQRGPQWLTNELYLIGQTVDQGVLYLSATNGRGKIGNVLTDFFALETDNKNEDFWWVFTHVNRDTDEYLILLRNLGGASGSPLLLYSSQSGHVEELHFDTTWSFGEVSDGSPFSPDGQWLFVGRHNSEGNSAADSYSFYKINSGDVFAAEVAKGLSGGWLSSDMAKITFFDADNIYVFDFPPHTLLSQWKASDYELEPIEWSPDSQHVIAKGNPLFSGGEALFVIKP
jgi:hypothetical protein